MMRFNPDKHNTAKINISNIKFELSVWIAGKYPFNNNDDKEVAQILTLDQGNFHVHMNFNEHDANALIDVLHQHIAHIKAAEIELLAQNTKVAA